MSWTTPVAPVAATLITASWGTTSVVNNLLALRATPDKLCGAYKQAQQTVSSTTAALTLTSEDYDTATMHDNSTNPARITIPSGGDGRYIVHGWSYIHTTITASQWWLHLQKNAVTIRSDTGTAGVRMGKVSALGLSLVAGEACAEAIAAVTGLDAEIKLPNDILLRGRKAAGILAEAREGRVVLGIGINVNLEPSELPTGVEPPATSLRVETGGQVDRAELLVELLERLERRYDAWVRGT